LEPRRNQVWLSIRIALLTTARSNNQSRIRRQKPFHRLALSSTNQVFERFSMTRHSIRLFSLAAAFLIGIQLLSAQQLATLNIAVRDPSGRALPNARVELKREETGFLRSQSTDGEGQAVLTALTAGNYSLGVQADGLSAYQQPLTLNVGQIASITVQLDLATVKQTISVNEATAAVETSKTDSSQVIHPNQIRDLPIAGRDFIDFVLLTPTANVGRSTATAAQSPFLETVLQLSFAGLRESHASFFGLDGTDYTVSLSGVQRMSPSLDWVQEFRVVDGPYTADNGRNLGSLVNTITKSGTNDVHGSAYEYFRNDVLNATNPLSAPGFDTLRVNQFGANVGGPIRKSKTFYFTGYEGQRRAASPTYSSFILGCINTEGCMGPGTPSINQVKQSFGLQPEQLGSILQIDNYDKAIGKVTHVFSENSVLNVGYLFNDDRKENAPTAAPGQGLPSTYRDNPVRDQTVFGNYLHLFGPHWTSESILDYGTRTYHLTPKGAGYEPTINVSDTLVSGGFTGSVSYYSEPHFESQENLTYVHGAHSFKFGGGFEPVWITADTTFFSPGGAIFTPQSFFGAGEFSGPPFGPGTAVQFLFLEPSSYFGQQLPAHTVPFTDGLYAGPAAPEFENATHLKFWHKLFNTYAQDQWKATHDLTLTYGLRYDLDLFPTAQDVRVTGKMQKNIYGNVQPRVGIAYALNGGKQVIRVGAGLFTGPWDYSDLMVGWQGASAFTHMNNPLVPNFANPTDSLVGLGVSGVVGVSGPFGATAAFRNFAATGAYPAPSSLQQFPLGYVQRDFPNPYAEHASLQFESQIGMGWTVTAGYQFVHGLDMPVYLSVNGTPSGFLPDGRQAFVPADAGFGFALLAEPIGYSNYNGGTLSLRKNFASHYGVLANYTYSKSIDLATDVQLTDTPQNYLAPDQDRALGDNDIRHRFVLSLMAESPSEWSPLLRNFKFSMLNTLQSPRYFSILAGFDVNGDGFPFSDRVGTSGRNFYRGDSYYDTDLRLQRVFHTWERLSTEASFEVFNILNRDNVQDIDQVYGAPDFLGPVPRQFGDGITSPANPTFGSPTFTSAARQMQISLRFNF
jgi:Carboxypeptidase regulatory-like domain